MPEAKVLDPAKGGPDEAATPAGSDGKRSSKESDPVCSYWKLYSYADRTDALLILIGIIGAVGGGMMFPIFSIIFGDFVNSFGDPGGGDFTDGARRIALDFVYVAIAAMVAMYMEVTFFVLAGERQTMRLRLEFLRSVLAQDIEFFDTQATTGGLLQGLNDDSIAVQTAISDRAAQFIHHGTCLLGGYIIAFVYGWDITLIMLGCMPILGAMGAAVFILTAKGQTASAKAYTQAATIAQQCIANVRTVAAYNGAEAAVRSYDEALDAPLKAGLKNSAFVGLSLGGMQSSMYFSHAAVLFYGAYRVTSGAYDGGQVLLVQLAALMASFALAQLAPILPQFAAGRAAGYRMFQVIERKPKLQDVGAGQSGSRQSANGTEKALPVPDEQGAGAPVGELVKVEGAIELRDVHFAYPARPDVEIFKGFSLLVPAGHTVALVGASGSGKSTAVQLIERFYDPLSGAVLLDGVDLRQLSLHWLRTQVGLVAQEPTLFATSIYENIAIGRPGCSKEDVVSAARAANAHKFIRVLPEGYATQVGERGVQLSGGQKQRIAIARAILKNPKVLLLDEATSALDTHSERVVQSALDRMVVGRTTVVVAHRLSTIQHAHTIAVVANGQVVEQGTHQQLLNKTEGAYALLVQMQQQQRQQSQSGQEQVMGTVEEQQEEGVEEPEEEGEGEVNVIPDDADVLLGGSEALAKEATLPVVVKVSPFAQGMPDAPPAAVPAAAAAGAPRTRSRLSSSDGAAAAFSVDTTGKGPGGVSGVSGAELAELEVAVWQGSLPVTDKTNKGRAPGAAKAGKLTEKEQDKLDEEAAKAVPFKRLLALNKKETPVMLLGLIGSALAGAQHPLQAFVWASFVVIFFDPDVDYVRSRASFYAWMFFVIGAGTMLAVTMQQIALGYTGQKLAQRVRVMLLGSLLRQEVAFFDEDAHSSGRLTSALATDAQYIRGAVGDALGIALLNLSTMVIAYGIALAYNYQMALVVTGAFPLLFLAMMLQMQFAIGASTQRDALYSGANQYISEAFSSIRIIHAFNLQSYITGRYRAMLDATHPVVAKQAHVGGAAMSFSFGIIFALYALIIWFGGWQIAHDKADFEQMLKGFLTILMAAMGMGQATLAFPDLGRAKAAVGRVFPLLDRQPLIDPDAPGDTSPDDQVKGQVAFNNIKFAYPSRPSVIIYQDFNLTIPAGKVYALVGESGSGKSTVVALLERFYDPQEGHILLDGVDIKKLSLKWLRQQIGLVSQEPILFAGTVADNIRYGAPGASIEEVEAAARIANAHEFVINLPEGYHTVVGEGGGIQLSGGQKQRIAIARAVIKNPRVLLLDEATSALDARSERVVQDALDSVMSGRTCLVIAHRLTTIKNAHAISVLYRGKVLEQGTHSELMSRPDSAYAKLVRAQETAHHA